jgi:hypothetical protein
MAVNPYRPSRASSGGDTSQGLADVLERVLNTGIVIAGDIQVSLLDIELLTIKIRLLVASADTAQQMGIDWWKHDPFLSGKQQEQLEDGEGRQELMERLERVEELLVRQLDVGSEPDDDG